MHSQFASQNRPNRRLVRATRHSSLSIFHVIFVSLFSSLRPSASTRAEAFRARDAWLCVWALRLTAPRRARALKT